MIPIIVREHDDLLRVLEKERIRRKLTAEEVDHRVGLTRGQTTKTENGGKPWGRGSFRMTPTIGWLLEFFGFRLLLVKAEQAEALIEQAQIADHRKPSRRAGPEIVTMAVTTTWSRPR